MRYQRDSDLFHGYTVSIPSSAETVYPVLQRTRRVSCHHDPSSFLLSHPIHRRRGSSLLYCESCRNGSDPLRTQLIGSNVDSSILPRKSNLSHRRHAPTVSPSILTTQYASLSNGQNCDFFFQRAFHAHFQPYSSPSCVRRTLCNHLHSQRVGIVSHSFPQRNRVSFALRHAIRQLLFPRDSLCL